MKNNFILIFIFFNFIIHYRSDEYDDDEDVTNKNIIVENGTRVSYYSDPTSEDIIPKYYKNTDDSSDAIVHSNRVLKCEDHSGAKGVCLKATLSQLCYEKETYAFSFCRKSCKYCDETDSVKHFYWRVVAGSTFKPTWAVSELKFYRRYPVEPDPLVVISTFANSFYPGYSPNLAFDDNPNTYWMPNEWGNHEADTNWIGGSISMAGIVNAIKITLKPFEGEILPTKLHVESATNMTDQFVRRWTVNFHSKLSGSIIVRPSCPPLWIRISAYDTTMCAKIFGEHVNWNQAKLTCQKHDAHLLSVENLDNLNQLKKKFHMRGPLWIGLNDRAKEGNYVWDDESKSDFLHWENGTPSDELRNQEEDCVYLGSNGFFQTASCQNRYFFACHKPFKPFPEIQLDPNEPNVDSPIMFSLNNFLDPILNTTESILNMPEEKMKNVPLLKIPINLDNNLTLNNSTPKLYPLAVTHNINDVLPQNNTQDNQTLAKIENEQAFHRFLQKKRKIIRKHNLS